MTKSVWEVGPNYGQPVTVQGHNLGDGKPLYIQTEEDTPTTRAVLDPAHPGHPASNVGDAWAEWGSYIVVPEAGCYTLDVSWATGHWSITFAAGA